MGVEICSFGVKPRIIKELRLHALRESDDCKAGGDYDSVLLLFFVLIALTGGTVLGCLGRLEDLRVSLWFVEKIRLIVGVLREGEFMKSSYIKTLRKKNIPLNFREKTVTTNQFIMESFI